MALDREIVIRVCAQLTKYLLEKFSGNVNISISRGQKYEVKIESRVSLSEEELNLLKNYLSVQPQEIGYYYLPLVGEYGSEEDLTVIAMLLEALRIDYDETNQKLELYFRVR